MFCDYCGTQLRNDAKFCHVCGAKLYPETICSLAPAPAVQMPAAMGTGEKEDTAAKQESPTEGSSAQPLSGTFSWENVKISGEFKDGVGTLTITFK